MNSKAYTHVERVAFFLYVREIVSRNIFIVDTNLEYRMKVI